MRMVNIAGKLVNVEQVRYVNHRKDIDTGRVYCLYVFDEKTVLQEVFADVEKFEQAMIKYGFLPKENEEIHHFKKLCIIGEDIIKKLTGRR